MQWAFTRNGLGGSIMSVISLLIASMLALFSFAPSGLAVWQGRNAINGTITDTEGNPLNRVRVELLNEVEMRITQTYTDGTGHYNFRNLTQGTFIVKAHSDGTHISQSVRVSLIAIRNNGGAHYEQVDMILKTREIKGTSVPANSGPTFAQDIPDNARKVYERAIKQLDNNKSSDQGVELLKEAVSIFPSYYMALERLGAEYVKRQQYEPARDSLTKAVGVNPNGAPSHYVLGVAQYHLHHMQDAADSLQRSLLLAPDSSNAALAHFYLGLANWKLGKRGAAESHLQKSYALGGNSIPPDIHLHLAQYYSDNGRYKESADELELFLKLAPDARDAENIRLLIKKLRAKVQ